MTLKEKLDIYIQSYTKITKIAGLVQFWTKLASIGTIAIMIGNALTARVQLSRTSTSKSRIYIYIITIYSRLS